MPDPGTSTPPGRILIVHDDNSVARDLEARLTLTGYAVAAVASTGIDIAQVMREVRPDVVLLDLPGGSDVEQIRQKWPVPVVFLTDAGDEGAARELGFTGPFGYVLAPFANRELRMNIEMAILDETIRTGAYELEDRFFAVSIDMLCCLDFNGYFKRLNPAWERALGFTRAELMAKPFIEFVHPDDRERTLTQNSAVRSGGRALVFENRYLCKDGDYRWFRWNAAPDLSNELIYSVARDITDRKRAEEERERMLVELRAALLEVRTLQEILPICSYCKKIRDDENYWRTVEDYISHHTNATFSHGICPDCYRDEVQPQLDRLDAD
jgi:PAS domain S-box-containing protein